MEITLEVFFVATRVSYPVEKIMKAAKERTDTASKFCRSDFLCRVASTLDRFRLGLS